MATGSSLGNCDPCNARVQGHTNLREQDHSGKEGPNLEASRNLSELVALKKPRPLVLLHRRGKRGRLGNGRTQRTLDRANLHTDSLAPSCGQASALDRNTQLGVQ